MKLLYTTLLVLLSLSCEDKYLTVERRVINTGQDNVAMYFWAQATHADSANTWKPIFYFYVYSLSEDSAEYDAYFHAYIVNQSDSIVWSGVMPIELEGKKRVYGEFVSDANFSPENIVNVTPLAYCSVEY